jgi:tetratricopeptide (TPR) repeat protein
MLLNLHRQRGQERNAIPPILKWAKDHSEAGGGRVIILNIVERYGTRTEIESALDETGEWLNAEARQNDTYVRTAYLGLVERKGTEDQVRHTVDRTRKWVVNCHDINVRQAWLRLVIVHGADDIREQVIAETKKWLANHAFAQSVWDMLIGYLFRADRQDEANELSILAITHHPEDKNLLMWYLRAVQHKADPQAIMSAYESLIEKHPDDVLLRLTYGTWLSNHGYYEKSETYLRRLVQERPLHYQARNRYGELLLKLERWEPAAQEFRDAIKIHKGFQLAHDGLANALWKLGNLPEAEKQFKQAIYWAKIKSGRQVKFQTHLGRFYISCERWGDALKAFEAAKTEDPNFWEIYSGIGQAHMGLGNFSDAEKAFRTALDKKPDLQPPASVEIQQWLLHCTQQLRSNHDTAIIDHNEISPTSGHLRTISVETRGFDNSP